MRLTFVGHASVLVETNGVSILSDPWWNGPCFGAQWWQYPEPDIKVLEMRPPDYIYISHGHHDHFHPTTLKTIRKATRIILPKDSDLRGPIEDMGFGVIEVSDDEHRIGNSVTCRIWSTGGGDSLMVVSDGTETCLNLNDALHAAPLAVQNKFIGLIKTFYPFVTYVFCGYGTASHFPNCYVIPGKDRAATAARRQSHFNQAWAKIVHDLAPNLGFPFAADVVFLEEDLFWCNEPVHNSERPTEVFERLYPACPTRVIDIAPGFVVQNGKILANKVREPVSNNALKTVYCDSIRRANSYRAPNHGLIEQVGRLLEDNIKRMFHYLRTFEGNYRFLISFKSSNEAIEIVKVGDTLAVRAVSLDHHLKYDYDLIYTTRLQYLKRSLTSQYGHETLFVGSGGIFEYTSTSRINADLHRELMFIIRKMDRCPSRAAYDNKDILSKTKRFAKKLLGRRTESDLYDLQKWTVFVGPEHQDKGKSTESISIPTR